MTRSSSRMWRLLFIVGGVLYLAGGFQHPRGDMLAMLRDPAWFRSHFIILIGLVLITTALVLIRRGRASSPSLDRWILFTIVATVLEVIEMAFHTVSMIDADSLAAGHATPTLNTHLLLAEIIYPIFGVIMFVFIFKSQKEGIVGSPWIGWIGMIGAAAHGTVMGLMLLEVSWARILFPIAAIALSLWYVLAGFWPAREREAVATVGDARLPSVVA